MIVGHALSCTSFSDLSEQRLSSSTSHLRQVNTSTNHSTTVEGQLPPKLHKVFSNVMYVPPTAGSL